MVFISVSSSIMCNTRGTVMNWTLCIICQKHTHEDFICLLNAPGDGDKSKVYAFLPTRTSLFKELNHLPIPLSFEISGGAYKPSGTGHSIKDPMTANFKEQDKESAMEV